MKKLIVLAVAVCLAFTVAIPAMAVDVDFSGYYRVRGFMNTNVNLDDQNEESEAYYDNRFRLQTVFTANDNVSVTTRFDALDDDRWGAQNENNIDFDRIYMDIKTDYGYFKIGHQQAGVWGLDVFDDDYNDDRIKYIGKAGDVIFGGIIQKTQEEDSLERFASDRQSDADTDVYYLYGIYKKDNIEAGLLGAWARQATTAPAYEFNFAEHGTTTPPILGPVSSYNVPIPDSITTKQALLPYWNLTFGPVGFKGEIVYEMGEMEYDNKDDIDISALSYNLEGSFNLDMAKLYAGWVTVPGQDPDDDDMTMGNTSYGGLGDDYNPFMLLTNDMGGKMLNNSDATGAMRDMGATDALNQQFPGLDADYDLNLDQKVALLGVNMWYLGADVTVNDKLTVKTILGQAMANEDDYFDDDEYGMEFDLGATYQIMDNLQYSATLAYLMTGDMLGEAMGVNKSDIDDNFGFMHELKVSF